MTPLFKSGKNPSDVFVKSNSLLMSLSFKLPISCNILTYSTSCSILSPSNLAILLNNCDPVVSLNNVLTKLNKKSGDTIF